MADLNCRPQDTTNAKLLRDTEVTGLPLISSRIPDPLLPDNHLQFHSIYGQRRVLTRYTTTPIVLGRVSTSGDLILMRVSILGRPHLSCPRPLASVDDFLVPLDDGDGAGRILAHIPHCSLSKRLKKSVQGRRPLDKRLSAVHRRNLHGWLVEDVAITWIGEKEIRRREHGGCMNDIGKGRTNNRHSTTNVGGELYR